MKVKRNGRALSAPLILLAIVAALFMAGCGPKATVAGYRQELDQYRGRHIDELVADWGAPRGNHSYADGRREYLFSRQSQRSYVEPAYPAIGLGLGYHWRHFGIGGVYHGGRQRVVSTSCETRVITDRRGKIQEFLFRGEACRALESER